MCRWLTTRLQSLGACLVFCTALCVTVVLRSRCYSLICSRLLTVQPDKWSSLLQAAQCILNLCLKPAMQSPARLGGMPAGRLLSGLLR